MSSFFIFILIRDTKRKYEKFRTGIAISFLRIKIKNLFALVVWVPVESVRTGADRPVELRNADCAAAANCNVKTKIISNCAMKIALLPQL